MLIQNNTQIQFSLDVNLEFDNGSTKHVVVKEGDYLLIYFRYNGMKLRRACYVNAIRPIVLDTQPESYAAEFICDCSSKWSAERLRIACKDILNLRKVDKDYIESMAPDYEITDDLLNQDALPPLPEEIYQTSAIGEAGIGYAELLR